MTAAQPRFAPNPARRAMLAKVHLAAKELGLSEGDYRAVLERVAGASSAAALDERALDRALSEFRRLGWKPARASGRRPAADHPSARKARALWISLGQLGVIRDSSDPALEAFARRQLGCERLQWADQAMAYKLIEALKAMAERAGWRQDVAGLEPEQASIELLRRLVLRLNELLIEANPEMAKVPLRFRARAYWSQAESIHDLHGNNLRALAGELASALRRARAKAAR